MPKGQLTPEQREAHSAKMRAYWRRRKAEARKASQAISQNGHVVESRIVLHVQGHEVTLTLAEAQALRDALVGALPAGTLK
jgi:hypothetical protein